jgi:glycosyltransferase involved in cell wall biosynthesis
MAKRKLIIGSELSPISTIVDNGINGFLIRPADVNSLEQLLNDILGGDVDTSSLGEKASQKIQNIFNTNKMVDQTLQAYKTTLENSGLYGSKWKSLIVNAMR